MKNNYFIKKPKKGWIVFLVLICGLFVNTAVGQDTFTWNGSTSNDWATAANWTKTGTAGTDTYPGETNGRTLDLVVISNGGTPIVASNVNAYGMLRLTINNSAGSASGSVLTINSGATIAVSSASISNVLLNGGNLVNNGTLNITSSSTATSCFGITCGNPTTAPTSATEYGYSGSGLLKVSISTGGANSAAIGVNSTLPSSLATYKFLFNGTTDFIFSSTATAHAIRSFFTTAGNVPFPVIIGGTGFTMGTVGSPVNGGLLNLGSLAKVTVNTGTTLTMNSASTNPTSGIVCGNSANNTPTEFTNKGTINILGATTRSGLSFSTFGGSAGPPVVASPNPQIINFTNEGTINVNINSSVVGNAAYAVTNGGGGTANAGSLVTLTNTSTGNITLKNTSTATGTGNAIYCFSGGEGAYSVFVNNGTLNLEGTVYSFGTRTTITNNGILNSNSEFRNFTSVTNNVGGSINFVRTSATATNRQVTFTITTSTHVSGAIGSIFRDTSVSPNIDYTIVVQKFSGGTNLVANVLSGVTIPASGTLTRVTGTGTASIPYSSVSIPALNNALPVTTTNSGTINTDTASNLNIISGVTTSGTSVIAPGGSIGKGIADFAKASAALTGKTILQIAGDATAGVDYDQITNSAVGGSLSVGGTLDLTGIYTPAGPVTIDIVTTEATGTLTGAFNSNVIGITTGWSVVTTTGTGGKVQLVYSATSPTVTTWTGGGGTAGWSNAANWSSGVPDQNSDVTIATGTFQPSSFVNATIKSLTIDSGASLTINSTYNLTVKEAITNNGTLTIANRANLIQVDNVTNTGAGTTTVNRNSSELINLDFTSWSSPVTGSQTLAGFSPGTSQSPSRFYNYNETTNAYNFIASPTTTPFATATGYLIRVPFAHPLTPTVWSGSFSGLVPNNGTITKAITYLDTTHGYNMVGNPYPSTIDAQTFIAANTANIESSLYFWRKTNGASGSSYAIYNPMGSTTASPSSALPNGTIQVGQGFFVKAKSASNLTFTNAMRVANTANQFFKTKEVAQKDRVWLNLTNASGAFSQALIGYTADATSGVDMFDAKYINDSPIALTSNINDEEYSIQGRPTFDATDVVALNFKTNVAGDYTIALDQFDGVFATGQDVYLADSKTGAETDLKAGSYTFNAAVGTDNTRFSLRYQKTLKVDAPAFDDNSISVYASNGTIYVNSKSVAISNIKVFDVQGRLLAEQNNVKSNTAVISNLRASNQVLIVKIAGEDNREVTKKLLN